MTTEIVKANFDVKGILTGIEGKVIVFKNRSVTSKEIKEELRVSISNLDSIIDGENSTRILAKEINYVENEWPLIRFSTISNEKPGGFDFDQNSYEMVVSRTVGVLKAVKLRKPTEGIQVTRK